MRERRNGPGEQDDNDSQLPSTREKQQQAAGDARVDDPRGRTTTLSLESYDSEGRPKTQLMDGREVRGRGPRRDGVPECGEKCVIQRTFPSYTDERQPRTIACDVMETLSKQHKL